MAWQIEFTAEAERWFMGLPPVGAQQVSQALDRLQQRGPQLGRPTVDSIKTSRHHNMKELRGVGGNIRVLFAFDPRRTAVVLVGGDKTGNWRGFYERAIPQADRLYDQHLQGLQGPAAQRAKVKGIGRAGASTDRNRQWLRTDRTRTGKPSAGREI